MKWDSPLPNYVKEMPQDRKPPSHMGARMQQTSLPIFYGVRLSLLSTIGLSVIPHHSAASAPTPQDFPQFFQIAQFGDFKLKQF